MAASFAPGWRQVAVGFMLLAATGMIASTYSIIAVPLAREFMPSRTVLMLAMTVLSGTSAVLAPLLGNLMDRLPLRRLMLAGGVSLALGYTAISLATSFTQVLVIFGVLVAPANVLIGPVAITVLLSRWFALKRGRAVGIAIAGISAGGFFFPMIIQALLDAHQWREALQLLALVLLAWTIPVTMLVIDHPSDRGLNPDGAAKPLLMAQDELAKAPISAREVLSDPTFWILAITVGIVTAGLKGTITNLAPLAIDAGIKARDAASLISIYSACGFIAKLNFAALSDRMGPRTLMYISLSGFATGMACLTQAARGYWMIAFGIALAGLFGGLMIPAESYLAPRVFGQRAIGRAMGLLSGTILLAMLATPPIFGLIFDVFGSYNGVFWTFAGLPILATVWVRFIRLHPRGESAPAKNREPRQSLQ
ncbi:MFS transporter [Novosphingobium sp. P6W]|uniref:MFS transporter n=1 Tax=Novosphingobium sp. P6W TaxID=1609758 RepID=UPI0005C313C9|nr:MFS transporter [Novosphingobium sp. P6W]AXB75966.1 MFS transporter [Novosphingobium sp. P6W]KIS31166.1 sugar phosphate permease [Novosphingobium sp. P6W]